MAGRNGARAKVAGCIGLLAAALAACQPEANLPPVPAITFKSFTQHGDSASLVIGFTDGDGDIGLDQYDNQPPFDTGSVYYHNLFLEYDTLHQGQWAHVEFALPLYYRMPRITPTGQNKALEGEIAVAIKPWPVLPGSQGDTIRISATLVDRALHRSNTVDTGPVRVQ